MMITMVMIIIIMMTMMIMMKRMKTTRGVINKSRIKVNVVMACT